MAENFRMDSSGLSAANSGFKVVGDDFSKAYDALTAVLDDHHGCWGTDDIGKAFEKNYTPSEKEIRDGGGEAVTGMSDLHEGIDESRKTFEGVDHESAQKIDQSTDD